MITSICVFCGSRFGDASGHRDEAVRLGHLCALAGLDLVYGGGHVGLMGEVADAAMAAGGRVIGLIPARLMAREVGHQAIAELIVTEGMSDRKDQMIARSDAFAILPGGLGTLDELFEVLTLRQLGYHDKPIVLINSQGYWDPLLAMIKQTVDGGFADADALSLMQTVDDVAAMFTVLGVPMPDASDQATMPRA